MTTLRHAYYLNARAEQCERATIANTCAAVLSDLKRRAISTGDAIATLREAGMFEAEIMQAVTGRA